MTSEQNLFPILAGALSPWTFPSASTLALNASATWLAYSFVPSQNLTVNSVRVFQSTLTGTPTNGNDFTAGIYSDSSGSPNTNLSGGSDQPCNATPSGNNKWLQFDGFTASVTADTLYWIVLKNPNTTDASPTTIFPTYQWFSQVLPNSIAGGGNAITQKFGYTKKQSANSGSTWVTIAQAIGGFQVIYSGSIYTGFPIQSFGSDTTKIFNNGTSSIEVGVKFTTPANSGMNVKGICFYINSNSSGVGPFIFKIYQGSSTSACTLLAQTNTIPTGNLAGSYPYTLHFSSPVTLLANTVYRVVAADTSSTGSAAAFIETGAITIDSTSPSVLTPFDGTMVKTTTPAGTSTIGNSPTSAFTDSSLGTLMFMALLLDTNGEFPSSGGTGTGFFIQ